MRVMRWPPSWLVLLALACHQETIAMDKHGPSDKEPLRIDSMGPDVVLPKIQYPDGMPFSAWEGYATRELLRANGFGNARDEWRRACASPLAVIRAGALLLLSESPDPADRGLFDAGLSDRYDAVRVWAARGLLQLGDPGGHRVLELLRRKQPADGEFAPLVASRVLGQHHDAAAFETIALAAVSLPDVIVVLKNLAPFVALQGQPYAPGATIDVWPLYARALAPGDGRGEALALAQLDELSPAGAARLLRAYLARQPPPSEPLKQRAERLLERLAAP